MSISLQKGGNISLTKTDPSLTHVLVCLGWDARSTDGAPFDLDASAIMLQDTGKVRSDADFCFYGQKSIVDGAIVHSGDNLTGGGDGDDETLTVELAKVPNTISKIIFPVTIYDHEARRQSFGQVSKAYVRIVNADTKTELARFDLTEDASVETAMIFAELYRKDAGWSFRAIGQGYAGGLKAIATTYGVHVG